MVSFDTLNFPPLLLSYCLGTRNENLYFYNGDEKGIFCEEVKC